jgi:hypothetical protein
MSLTASEICVKVFICYSHADQDLRNRLEEHLSALIYSGAITIWQDQKIPLGANWEDQINTHLNEAGLILPLISARFIASNYCWNKELKIALQRHKEGTARVVPIILRPVHWQDTPLGQLQALPTGIKPVTQWDDQDEAFEDVVRGIQTVVEELRPMPREQQHERELGRLQELEEEAGVSAGAKNSNAVPLIVEKQSTLQKSRFPIFRPPTTGIFLSLCVAIIIVSVIFASAFGGIIGVKLSGLSLAPSPTIDVPAIPTPSFYGDPQFHPPNTALILCGGARDGGKGWQGSSPDLSYHYTGPDYQGHNCSVNSYTLTPPQHFLIYRPDGGPPGGWPVPLSAKSVDLWIYISPVWHSAQAQYSLQFDGPSQTLRSWPPLDQQFCDHWLLLGNALIPQEATHVKLIVTSTNTTPGYFADNAAALDFHPVIPTTPLVPSTNQQCKKGSSPMQ